jgi:hypothetical protein
MEIGSFIELELRDTGEFFQPDPDIARLNTGRGGICFTIQQMNISRIHLPYYLCPTVKSFLLKKGIEVLPYHITDNFDPILSFNDKSTAVLLVNYFGIFSEKKITELKTRFQNVIVDNCPAFYCPPVKECYNVYSARKFFGVPDGCYVVGPAASDGIKKYNQDSSSDTSAFLLKRIEKGCSAVYPERMENEKRLDQSDILQMSDLTRRILSSVDYEYVKTKRRGNFDYAHKLFKKHNLLDPEKYMDQSCVPLVYPLLVEDEDLVNRMKDNKVYTGRWWTSVLNDVPEGKFEAFLSRFMVPIPIDQRYGKEEIEYMFRITGSIH